MYKKNLHNEFYLQFPTKCNFSKQKALNIYYIKKHTNYTYNNKYYLQVITSIIKK